MASQQQALLGSTHSNDSPALGKNTRIAPSIWLLSVLASGGVVLSLTSSRLEYTTDSDFGYYLGLAGGIAMLLTLLYPVAKRVRLMHSWVRMRHWFHAHMLLGIVGPILILLHSRLAFESINGTVAFSAMCLVFLSGLTGRYLHTKIHSGLEDRRAFLQQLKQKIGVGDEEVRSKFRFAPHVTKRLEEFEVSVLAPSSGLLLNFWQFLTLSFRIQRTYFAACKDLKHAIRVRAKRKGWDLRKARRRFVRRKKMVRDYLDTARSVARSGAYERLFSLWHIVHIPLLFWLAITGAIHVLAVHMY